MPIRSARRALLLALSPLLAPTLLLGLAVLPSAPASAESPAKAYQYGRQLGSACRPPLKFAAGACVRRCPAGFQDNGRTCRQRSMRR